LAHSVKDRTPPLWIVLGLAMAPAVALGFARLAYALLLPSMRDDLGWTYADAGAMNTANAVGYLIGALGSASIAARAGLKRTFATGLWITVIAIPLCDLTSNFDALLVVRAVAGLSGAIAFVTGASLVSASCGGDGARRSC
jgi:predicted MFS family arabinose efflux permease